MQLQMLSIWMLVQKGFKVVIIKEVSLMLECLIQLLPAIITLLLLLCTEDLSRKSSNVVSEGFERWKFIRPFGFFDFWGNGWGSCHCFQKNYFFTVSEKQSILQSVDHDVLVTVLHQLFLVVVCYNLLAWSLFHP